MGMLRSGKWSEEWYDTAAEQGRFVRQSSRFRDQVTFDGHAGCKAEGGRYHLYVSHACPWAHRCVIFRRLKGLENVISMSVVLPLMLENGWEFSSDAGVFLDPVMGARYLYETYIAAESEYTGRVTVPVLWDKQESTIVSNESSDIIRMFNAEFNSLTDVNEDYYPESLRSEIDAVNARVYTGLNNGVYRAGFASTQEAYDSAVHDVFETLDWLDMRLRKQRYLVDEVLTEADWRAFTSLIRFDPVYHGHFKCNRRKLIEYDALWAYTRDLYQVSGVAETVFFDQITTHYYGSHATINPTGIVPVGPSMDLTEPHGRERL